MRVAGIRFAAVALLAVGAAAATCSVYSETLLEPGSGNSSATGGAAAGAAGSGATGGGAGTAANGGDGAVGGTGAPGGAGAAGGAGGGAAGGATGGGGASCTPSVIVIDWAANPAPVITKNSGSCWSVGASMSPYGPGSGTLLATVPADSYPKNRDDWAMLEPIDLSALGACSSVVLTMPLWREADSGYDGGNLQATADPAPGPASSWAVVGDYPGTMAYDTATLKNCGGCLLPGQPAWTGAAGNSKNATADLSAYAGKKLTLRFAFHSDGISELDGLYIGPITLTVE